MAERQGMGKETQQNPQHAPARHTRSRSSWLGLPGLGDPARSWWQTPRRNTQRETSGLPNAHATRQGSHHTAARSMTGGGSRRHRTFSRRASGATEPNETGMGTLLPQRRRQEHPQGVRFPPVSAAAARGQAPTHASVRALETSALLANDGTRARALCDTGWSLSQRSRSNRHPTPWQGQRHGQHR